MMKQAATTYQSEHNAFQLYCSCFCTFLCVKQYTCVVLLMMGTSMHASSLRLTVLLQATSAVSFGHLRLCEGTGPRIVPDKSPLTRQQAVHA